MSIPDRISESLETLLWVELFDADPDPGSFRPWIRVGKNSDPGSRICIPDQ